MFNFIGMVLAGLAVGICAKFLMPGPVPGGMFLTVLLGMTGALVGGWLGQIAGLYGPGQPAGFVMSVLGAIALLSAHRMIRSTV